MTIAIRCQRCESTFKVQEKFAGKRAKCAKCGETLVIPSGSVPASSVSSGRGEPIARGAASDDGSASPSRPNNRPSALALQDEILQAFQGEIPRVRTSPTYKFGILTVCVVMILLPMIYLGLIGLVAFGVYYHMVHDVGMLSAGRGRGAAMVLLAYIAPLVIGVILIFFMIKPLFARATGERRTRSLTRDGEPVLFAFVDRLCQSVHAPRPRQILIDSEVNASAGFRRGLLSLLVGRDLVLTIGMPLVAGLTMRQFAGVLAHEFGHFSQGAGMRLTYLIRMISMWFTRVVYERDSWDAWLASSAQGVDLRIGWILYLAQFFVWLTRKILWVLMMIGHLVSGYMLRQMEFDADRYEARLAGSDTFETTCRRLGVLNVGLQAAHDDLSTFYREGRLADNLPRLIMANVEQLAEPVLAQLNEAIDNSETGLLDTHPADRDRIASAQREQAAGLFRLEHASSDLFVHYDKICRDVTWDFYRGVFGPEFKQEDMHPIDDLLRRREQSRGDQESLKRYFLGGFNLLRPIRVPAKRLTAPSNAKATAEQLKAARQRLQTALPEFIKSFAAYEQADTQTLEAGGAEALHQALLKVPADQFGVPVQTRQAVGQAKDAAGIAMSSSGKKLEEFEVTMGERLVNALRLLFVPQVASRIPDAESRQRESSELLPLLNKLGELLDDVIHIRNDRAALALLFNQIQGNEENEALFRTLQERAEGLEGKINEVRAALAGERYPFEHAKGEMSLAQYILADPPVPGEIGEVYEAAERVLDRMADMYVRITSRLSGNAECVEKVLGLPPLEIPEQTG
jgi:Zn-dependent protease with chaperone function